MVPANLFEDVPSALPVELITALAADGGVRIERIVSTGHATLPNVWFDQPRHEWVLLLKGSARLRFAGEEQAIELRAGDYLSIPAHVKHRVEWTTPDEPTVWLAVHYGEER